MRKTLDDILLIEPGGKILLGDGAEGINFSGIRAWRSGDGAIYRLDTFKNNELQIYIGEDGKLHSADESWILGATGAFGTFSGKILASSESVINGVSLIPGTVISRTLADSAKIATTNVTFSSSSYNTVNWTSGTLKFADGRSFNISSGSTGAMSAPTYIVFDRLLSSLQFVTSTDFNVLASDTATLICNAKPGATTDVLAHFVAINDQMLLNVNQLNVNYLSALSGDMGDLTVGRIKLGAAGSYISFGATPPISSTAGTGLFLDYTGLYGLASNVQTFNISASTGAVKLKSASSGQRFEINTTGTNEAIWYDASGNETVKIGTPLTGPGYTDKGILLKNATVFIKGGSTGGHFRVEDDFFVGTTSEQRLVSAGANNYGTGSVRGTWVYLTANGGGSNMGNYSEIQIGSHSANAQYGSYSYVHGLGYYDTSHTAVFGSAQHGLYAYGVKGEALTGINCYGLYGKADSQGSNLSIGVYGHAVNSTVNWAGYFDGGNVYITNQIQIAGGTPGVGKVLTSNATGLATWENAGTITTGWTDDGAVVRLTTSTDQVSIGTATGYAKLAVLSTTEQLRLLYDASNYSSSTVASNGAVTYDSIGTAPSFSFLDNTNIGSASVSSVFTQNYNGIVAPAPGAVANIVTGAALVNNTAATVSAWNNSPALQLKQFSWNPTTSTSQENSWYLHNWGFSTPGDAGGVLVFTNKRPSGPNTYSSFAIDEIGRTLIGYTKNHGLNYYGFWGEDFGSWGVILAHTSPVVVGWPENGVTTNFRVTGNTTLSGTANAVGTITSGVWNGSSVSTTYTDAKVTSAFGRTGAVTAQSGDYSAFYSPLAGSTSITTLGTIATGVWNGSAISDTYLSTISTAGKVSGGAITSGTIGGTTVWNAGAITTNTNLIINTSGDAVIDTRAASSAFNSGLVTYYGGVAQWLIGNNSNADFSLYSYGTGTGVFKISRSTGAITVGTWQGSAIADTYLATISTAGKVSGNAITSGTISGSTSINTTGTIAAGNTVNVVSPTNLNRTVTMVFGGTTLYLAAKTTND